MTVSQKVIKSGTPVKTGVPDQLSRLDSRFRGNNEKKGILTFYEHINNELCGSKKHKSTIYQDIILSQQVPENPSIFP